MNETRNRWKLGDEHLFLVLILVLAFVLRMAFLREPFERDEGLYGYIGQEILRGAVPYRDVADLKPPGSFYLYAAFIALLGSTTQAIRVATGIYALVTTFFVHRAAREVQGPAAGLSAALLFAVFSNAPAIQGSSSNTEVFMLLPLVVCVHLSMRGVGSGRRGFLAGSGFAGGLAVLIKTVALPYVALVFVFLVLRPQEGGGVKGRLRDALHFLAPPVATALLTFGYFATQGALGDLFYWNVTIHKKYVQSDSSLFFAKLRMSLAYLRDEQGLLWLAGLASALFTLIAARSYERLLIAALLPVSMLGVVLPGHFFPHYFIQVTPFFAIAGGVGLGRLWQRKGWPTLAVAPLIAGGLFLHARYDYPFYFEYTPNEVSRVKYATDLFVESVEVARFIKERTTPSDYILQWGFEQELYFLSNRRGLKNMQFYLGVGWSPNPEKALRELVEGLAVHKPRYVVLQRSEQIDYTEAAGFTELAAALEKDYFIETTMGYATLYRRLDDPS